MMLEFLGWHEAAQLIERGLAITIQNKTVTYDLQRQIDESTLLKCSEFADQIIKNM